MEFVPALPVPVVLLGAADLSGQMGVGHVAEPDPMDAAAAGHVVERNLLRVGGIVEVVDDDSGLGRIVVSPLYVSDVLAVLNHDVPDDLNLMAVSIFRLRDLTNQLGVLGIGDVENREGEVVVADVGDVNEVVLLHDLHGVADAVQVVVADEAGVLGLALGGHVAEALTRLGHFLTPRPV